MMTMTSSHDFEQCQNFKNATCLFKNKIKSGIFGGSFVRQEVSIGNSTGKPIGVSSNIRKDQVVFRQKDMPREQIVFEVEESD